MFKIIPNYGDVLKTTVDGFIDEMHNRRIWKNKILKLIEQGLAIVYYRINKNVTILKELKTFDSKDECEMFVKNNNILKNQNIENNMFFDIELCQLCAKEYFEMLRTKNDEQIKKLTIEKNMLEESIDNIKNNNGNISEIVGQCKNIKSRIRELENDNSF